MLFLLYVIVEVAAVWLVASYVGVLWTVLLLLAGAILGSALARREGRRAMEAMLRKSQTGGTPHKEISDGMLIGIGGVLILVPGFVTDLVGLLFLLPGSRSLMRKAVARSVSKRRERFGAMQFQHAQYRRRESDSGMVVDGEIVDDPTVRHEQDQGRPDEEPRNTPPRIIEG